MKRRMARVLEFADLPPEGKLLCLGPTVEELAAALANRGSAVCLLPAAPTSGGRVTSGQTRADTHARHWVGSRGGGSLSFPHLTPHTYIPHAADSGTPTRKRVRVCHYAFLSIHGIGQFLSMDGSGQFLSMDGIRQCLSMDGIRQCLSMDGIRHSS